MKNYLFVFLLVPLFALGQTQKFNLNVELKKALIDSSGGQGASGQVLSSTGSAVAWIDPPATGSDSQTLTLNGGQLSIENGNAVMLPLPIFLTDTDGDTRVEMEQAADEDVIRFATNNLERMVIDNTGRIGIGTDEPSSQLRLHALTTSAASSYIGRAQEVPGGGLLF